MFHVEKNLNGMFPWCSSVGLTFCSIFITFPKYSLFLTVLVAGYQRRRLHTDLTSNEHPFGKPWPATG